MDWITAKLSLGGGGDEWIAWMEKHRDLFASSTSEIDGATLLLGLQSWCFPVN